MRYFLDTEFNSFGGSLISLGLVRDDTAEALYLIIPGTDLQRMRGEEGMDPWIEENVIDNLFKVPNPERFPTIASVDKWGVAISDFIYREGETPQIIVDWPSDAMDIARLLMTGPGTAVPMGNQTHITILRHIDVYPTSVPNAVQHNAFWDAMAIRQLIREMEAK